MRVLLISNDYPPYELGGESLSCASIADGLERRGHTVEVLTSDYGRAGTFGNVHRQLKLEMEFAPLVNSYRFFLNRRRTIDEDCRIVQRRINTFRPDLVLLGSMWNLPRQVPATAEGAMVDKVIYRFGDYWPTLPSQHQLYWQTESKNSLLKPVKRGISALALNRLRKSPNVELRFPHVVCISEAVRDEFNAKGIQFENCTVIHNGVDLTHFEPSCSPWIHGEHPSTLKLLYLGRLAPEKGVNIAIDSLYKIKNAGVSALLTIVGAGSQHYERDLKELASKLGILKDVKFIGWRPHNEIPTIISEHHVMLVPSLWVEPFGRVVLEGMASGLIVIGSGSGGMRSVLVHERTGLIPANNDAESYAYQLKRLLSEPTFGQSIVANAAVQIQKHFSLEKMIDRYEMLFLSVLEDKNPKVN